MHGQCDQGQADRGTGKLGGNQSDYADESELVRSLYAEALAKHGLISQMDKVYQDEIATLPPLPA